MFNLRAAWNGLVNSVYDYFDDNHPIKHRPAYKQIQAICHQTRPKQLKEIIPKGSGVRMVGKGGYGEVFTVFKENHPDWIYKFVVLDYFKGVRLRRVDSVRVPDALVELQASVRMRDLAEEDANYCSSFISVSEFHLVYDRYPSSFVMARYEYVLSAPKPHKHHYIVYKMEDKGTPLSKLAVPAFSPEQCHSIITQTLLALWIAEKRLGFEHRDLHPGNILVKPVPEGVVPFFVRNQPLEVANQGVVVTIIDFSVSRLRDREGNIIYIDFGDNGGDYCIKGHIEYWRKFHPRCNAHFLAKIPNKLQTLYPDVRYWFVCLKEHPYRTLYDFELECSCSNCSDNIEKADRKKNRKLFMSIDDEAEERFLQD